MKSTHILLPRYQVDGTSADPVKFVPPGLAQFGPSLVSVSFTRHGIRDSEM
jgi:hypothetical protein